MQSRGRREGKRTVFFELLLSTTLNVAVDFSRVRYIAILYTFE